MNFAAYIEVGSKMGVSAGMDASAELGASTELSTSRGIGIRGSRAGDGWPLEAGTSASRDESAVFAPGAVGIAGSESSSANRESRVPSGASFRSYWQAVLSTSSSGKAIGPGLKPGAALIESEKAQEENPNAELRSIVGIPSRQTANEMTAASAPAGGNEELQSTPPNQPTMAWIADTARPGLAGALNSIVPSKAAAEVQTQSAPVELDRETPETTRSRISKQASMTPTAGAESQLPATNLAMPETPVPMTPSPITAESIPAGPFPAGQSDDLAREFAPAPMLSSAMEIRSSPGEAQIGASAGESRVADYESRSTDPLKRPAAQAQVATSNSVSATRYKPQAGGPGGVLANTSSDASELPTNEQNASSASVDLHAMRAQAMSPSTGTNGWDGDRTPEERQAASKSETSNERSAGADSTPQPSPLGSVNVDTPGSNHGMQSATPILTEPRRRDRSDDWGLQAMREVTVQPLSANTELSAGARLPGGANGIAGAIAEHAGASTVAISGAATGNGTREAFAALDSGTDVGTGMGAPSWIHAGYQRAEAGFQDPSLGWVGVRADLSGGNVHAALVPGSVEAAQALSAHLSGLNAYLTQQHSPVSTLVMAAPGGSGDETGARQNMQQGAGQQAGQEAPAETQSSLQSSSNTVSRAAIPDVTVETGGLDTMFSAGGSRGAYISVMA